MASRWPTVILAAFTAAGGYIAGDWMRTRETNDILRKSLDNASAAQTRAAAAERRMVTLEHRLAQEKDKFNAAVDQSNLAGCPIPEPVGGMLDDLAEKAANPRVPGARVR